MVTDPRADLIEAFENGGGSGPRYAEVALRCAAKEEDARETAHHYFRWSLTGWPVIGDLAEKLDNAVDVLWSFETAPTPDILVARTQTTAPQALVWLASKPVA
jgi:hypothetical protein